jgi:hypothetical protein
MMLLCLPVCNVFSSRRPKGHGHCLLRTVFVADIGCNSWEPPLHFRNLINSAPDGMEERERGKKRLSVAGLAWAWLGSIKPDDL